MPFMRHFGSFLSIKQLASTLAQRLLDYDNIRLELVTPSTQRRLILLQSTDGSLCRLQFGQIRRRTLREVQPFEARCVKLPLIVRQRFSPAGSQVQRPPSIVSKLVHVHVPASQFGARTTVPPSLILRPATVNINLTDISA